MKKRQSWCRQCKELKKQLEEVTQANRFHIHIDKLWNDVCVENKVLREMIDKLLGKPEQAFYKEQTTSTKPGAVR